MKAIKPKVVGDEFIDQLIGLQSSKIGFYSEVRQKIQELEAVNLGLRAKQLELQTIFDAIKDGVVIYDSERQVQHRNHVSRDSFAKETTRGSKCCQLFHPGQELAPESCPVERALLGESFQWTFSADIPEGATSSKRVYEVSATPIANPLGGYRALLFLRDVTIKRAQELSLLQAEKMSSIGFLAAGVAHEINNPMNAMAGYAEALLRRLSEHPDLLKDSRLQDFSPYLAIIVHEVYRCKGIIDRLLSFSRKSDGTEGDVDLNMIIGEVFQLLDHRIRYENIDLREALAEDLPRVKGNASELRQVFLNILVNAAQAIDGGGTINVSTRSVTDFLEVSIADSGAGIPPELIDKIWTPFFTTKDVGKGSGLGLALAYDIVKKHGGEITVESRVGKGTKFTLRFPICQ